MTSADLTSVSSPPETVLERFQRTAYEDPDRGLYVFVGEAGEDEEALTYGALMQAVSGLIKHLTFELGLRRGDRVILVYPPSLDFVTAFIACLAAGLVPVPVAPLNPFKLGAGLSTFEATATSCGATGVLTNRGYLRKRRLASARAPFGGRESAWRKLPWHATDGVGDTAEPVAFDPAGQDEPAFLQYTSGSTSTPKGVVITHGNISHQLTINASDLGLDTTSRSVIWLPHFHDFCLVSGILSALHGNGILYLMSPLVFLRRPQRWFEVLSRVGGTHTCAPDFAFRLAVRRTTPEQREQWNLSSLQVVMSAGEPIRPSTVESFLTSFAGAGLDPQAFGPAYGLAEHTVGVATSGRSRLRVDRKLLEDERRVVPVAGGDEAAGMTIFGCGPPSPGVDVRIVDPSTARELGPGWVGEIWVDSPSKALGYYGMPELSQGVFYARLEGSAEGKTYLRTGDMGFLHDGEVHIAGRLKDMIIVRGRNLYPQDLEESVYTCHPLVRAGRAVAFPTPAAGGDGEAIAVLLEVRKKKASTAELDEVAHAVRSHLVRDHKVTCEVVLIAPPGVVLKTSSGKLRRDACRRAYAAGEFAKQVLRVDVLHGDGG